MNITENQEFYKTLGIKLKEYRKANKYSAKDIASYIGNISYQQYLKYENATDRISIYKLYQLSRIYNLNIEFFLPSIKPTTEPIVEAM